MQYTWVDSEKVLCFLQLRLSWPSNVSGGMVVQPPADEGFLQSPFFIARDPEEPIHKHRDAEG
jgi:hypothetical protein